MELKILLYRLNDISHSINDASEVRARYEKQLTDCQVSLARYEWTKNIPELEDDLSAKQASIISATAGGSSW
jgi:hypothetical protein